MDSSTVDPSGSQWSKRLVWVLSLTIVFVGMLNAMPGIPGFEDSIRTLTGLEWLKLRRYPTDWLYPLVFSLMMICVVADRSTWTVRRL